MSKNAQNSLLREVGLVFEPISSLDSAHRVTMLFRELGYELPGNNSFPDFPGLAQRMKTIIQILIKFDQADDDAKVEILAELTVELIQLTKEVIALEQEVNNAVSSFPDFISNAPLKELPARLLDYLIIEYTAKNRQPVHAVMSVLGIFERIDLPVDNTIYQPGVSLRKIFWERLPKLITDPVGLFNDIYEWDSDFNTDKFFTNVDGVLRAFLLPGGLYQQSSVLKNALGNTNNNLKELRFPILQNSIYPSVNSQFGLTVTAAESQGSKKTGFAIVPYIQGETDFDFELNENFEISFEANASLDAGIGIIIRPDDLELMTNLFDAPADAANLNAELAFKPKENVGEIILFGSKDATRLAIEDPSMKVFVRQGTTDDVGFETRLKALRLVITGGEGDGFLNKILGDDGIKAEAGFMLGYSGKGGFYFSGGAGLELLIPAHITLGPLEIQGLLIGLKVQDEDFNLSAGANLKVDLGPLVAVVENMGITSKLSFPEDGGNLGPANLDFGFKPPNGLGLAINAGAVTGGGYLFFDHENGEYAGALELTIAEFISAKAIGLITTKMPDGSKGFSMLVIITAEFNPPFQLGYGFTLNGVGGLLGLNRTVLLDPLRDGVRTGAVNNIMFPDNVIANATRIISDLKTIFPPNEDKFLIGPMGKVGWGTPSLITLSVGLIIEIPGNVAILGVLKIALPEERIPLVQIQVAFVGTLNFDKKMLTFDASLYESFILHMTLEGDMAVRLKWGDQPDFILTVGGFHPSFTPPPLALPTLKRLSISILNTSIAKIRVECYQAVTSNTVQFGAKAEIYFDLKACSIDGHIAFDALFQFSPFYFIIQLSSSFNLKAAGISVMSVRVKMSLEGTTPWKAKGTGSVSLLFVTISADFNKTWGDKKDTSLPKIEILPKLLEELHEAAQWSTDLVSDKNLLVTLRKLEAASSPELILHPSGSLMVQQKLMPLSVNIDKVGNQKTSDIKKAVISGAFTEDNIGTQSALAISEVNENFARAQYQELKDSEKLSKPSFEKMPGGVRISMGNNTIRNGKMVRKKVEYDVTIVDKEPRKPFKFGKFFTEIEALFTNFLKGGSVAKSVLSLNHHKKLQPFQEKLDVLEEGYTVAFQSDNKAVDESATFSSEMMAQSYMQDQISKNPSLKGEVHIIPNFELQAA